MQLKIGGWVVVSGLVGFFALPAHAASGDSFYGFQPAWAACTFDSECVVLPDPCKDPAAVNSRSRYAYQRWAEELARSGSVSCGGLQGNPQRTEALCDTLHRQCYIRNQP